jgi:membrane associated rhomboid family serine protease
MPEISFRGPHRNTPEGRHRFNVDARGALITVVALFVLIWAMQIVNNFDGYRLSVDYGIEPRTASTLPYIFTAPFLHWSWAHIEGNSVPFLILGFLAAMRGIPKFLWVTLVVAITSGLFAWLVSPANVDTVGASGVIFGWLAYVVVRGFFNHHWVDIAIGLLVGINYLGFFSLLFPAPHLSYQAHIGGLIGGVLSGWFFRDRPDQPKDRPKDIAPAPAAVSAPPTVPTFDVDAELDALKAEVGKDAPGHR